MNESAPMAAIEASLSSMVRYVLNGTKVALSALIVPETRTDRSAGVGWLQLPDQACLDGDAHQSSDVVGVEFAHQVGAVGIHGARADEESFADLFVAQAFS